MVSKAMVLSAALLAAMSGCETQEAGVEANVTSAADKGEVVEAGARLTWARTEGVLRYTVTYQAPNACYSAGNVSAAFTPPAVTITAAVAFAGEVCAQVITPVTFEGTLPEVTGPFTLAAAITDEKSGEVVTLSAP